VPLIEATKLVQKAAFRAPTIRDPAAQADRFDLSAELTLKQ
jgi:hypothetical protein